MLLITKSGDSVSILTERDGLLRLKFNEDWADFKISEPVRVIGLKENAGLLLSLAEKKADVWVGTPQLLWGTGKTYSATQVLLSMQQVKSNWLPSSVGGWHRLTADELLVYKASELWETSILSCHSVCQEHPVVQMVDRTLFLSAEYISAVMGCIRDPRWFINRVKPDSGSMLRAFMCLHLKSMADRTKAKLVKAIWKNSMVLSSNASFVWKHWHNKYNHSTEADADLSTSRLVLSFIRHVWLAIQNQHTGVQLFDPTRFMEGCDLDDFLKSAKKLDGHKWCIGVK